MIGGGRRLVDRKRSLVYSAGFTLIELLVVIAVIALLMGILLPVLGRVRKQARAVACCANLKQWATTLALYLEDSEGRFPRDETASWWILTGQTFFERRNGHLVAPRQCHPIDTESMLCPEATKPSYLTIWRGGWDVDGQPWHVERCLGSTFEAWKVTITGLAPFVGSYGLNHWLFACPEDPSDGIFRSQLPKEASSYTNVFGMRGRSTVPLLLDCVFDAGAPTDDSPPPHTEYQGGLMSRSAGSMANFCINRHSGYVNCLFLDWSVRKVGLKELWTLKWHENFNTANSWTRAGGVQPGKWPTWMRKFKDY